MKAPRLSPRNRVRTGTLAVLMVYVLALQGVLSGWAQGLMAASAAELPAIICSASDPAPADPAQDRPSSGKAAHDCCGTLCRLASAAMPAILDGNAGFVRFEAADPVDASRPAASVSRTSLRGLIGEPRAPPVSV